ncbi:MAG: hypothetical protein IJ620_04935 [Bacteroidales bacterium]|nr:hypothetical protein [Bacteroidales bacterium]
MNTNSEQPQKNSNHHYALLKGMLTVCIGVAICVIAVTQIKGETLQMGILSIGALTAIAGGIVMLFGRG